MKRFIIFDYDGVLVDSEILYHRIFIKELGKYGVKITSEELTKHFSGNSNIPFNKKILDYSSIELPESFYVKTIQKVFKELDTIKAIPNTLETLEKIKNQGVKFCIASGGRREWTLKTLKSTGLNKYFSEDMIFTRESVENGKPAPDIFLFALDKCRYNKEDAIVVEDSMNGLKAGVNSGVKTVAFMGGSHITDSYIQEVKNLKLSIITNLLEISDYL